MAMSSVILNQTWDFAGVDPGAFGEFVFKTGLPLSVATFLYQRGMRLPEEAMRHMSPSLTCLGDPWLMKDMDKAVSRLVKAVSLGEKVAVFGDYDADGVTSSVVLSRFLKEIGLETMVYIPHRELEGYGLNREAIRYLEAEGCRLLVTVDCGVANVDEVEFARSIGMDVIITDHHESPEILPRCEALINPKRPDCPFPFKELAGVGVIFYLVRALRTRLRQLGHWSTGAPPNLKAYLDLVALGTVTDMVPLLGDNRTLVRVGLEVISRGSRPGIVALKEVSRVGGDVNATDLAFRLGPRINAAGRMAHAQEAFELLATDDIGQAEARAQGLNRLNQERQVQERAILKDALSLIEKQGERAAYVLASPNWKRGIVGIVASKLMDQVGRPVILLERDGDMAIGSGRCPDGLNLYEILSACSGYLDRFGGHRAAAGMRLTVKNLEVFAEALDKTVASILRGHDVQPRLKIDGYASLAEFTDPAVANLFEILEPFGAGYQPPLFAIQDFSLRGASVVGKGHLKLLLNPVTAAANGGPMRPVEVMAWGQGDKRALPWNDLELACIPCFNTWQGRKTLQLRLKDARTRR